MSSLERALHQSKVLAWLLVLMLVGVALGVAFFLKQVNDDNASRQRSAAQAELLERNAQRQQQDINCVKAWADALEAWLLSTRRGHPPRFYCTTYPTPRPTVTIAPPTVTRTRTAPAPPPRTVSVPQPPVTHVVPGPTVIQTKTVTKTATPACRVYIRPRCVAR